jgi:hypothetical protein
MNSNDDIRTITVSGNKLLDRVVSILDQARTNVIKAVNSNMVIAYWLIGREIVQELQHGDPRAEYGKELIKTLSKELNSRYGQGFSTTNIKYFRLFYQTYADREPIIRHKACDESEKSHTPCPIPRCWPTMPSPNSTPVWMSFRRY